MDNNIQRALDSVTFTKKEDWAKRQICGDFPNVDARSLVFCCSPIKPCVLRNLVLKKLNISLEEYIKIKEKSAEEFAKKIEQ